MANGFPHPVGGRISDETNALLEEAKRGGATEGALVRMALEDYLPRYVSGQVHTKHAELLAKLGEALKRRPVIADRIAEFLVNSARPSRRTK